MYTHAQFFCLQIKNTQQRSLKTILEENDVLKHFLKAVKLDANGKLDFPWKLWDEHDLTNLTKRVGDIERLVSDR